MSFVSLLILVCVMLLISGHFPVHAQQPYAGNATTLCNSKDDSKSGFGYTCNGVNTSCQSFLTFRSQSQYNSVSSISGLLGADPSQLSQLNSVAENATFDTDQVVLVPVTCSCSNKYYQSNTSFVAQNQNTYLFIANNTFQSLTTCQALQAQNSNSLFPGTRLNVPLRCACPTQNQSDGGVNYLLSYLVTWGQSISVISSLFGVDAGGIFEANSLSEQHPDIYPFTTLLVPLQTPPENSQTIAPPPPSTPPPPQTPPPSKKSSNKMWVHVVIGIFGGGGLVLGAAIIVFYLFWCKKLKKTDSIITSKSFESIENPYDANVQPETNKKTHDFLRSISDIAQSLKVYTYQELQSATKNFNPSCQIEGSVYRGRINGDFAAIKKMEEDVSKEIDVLNKISHFNLIGLSGICFNDGDWYLVYEYVANGPLSDWIFSNNIDQKFLNWTKRVRIALDVATGINYIHNYISPPYVHKDITSSNVLLDIDFRAKIANFGLARSAEAQDGQFSLTTNIVGTKGYMAPEYLQDGFVSTKLDVYAFGVVLLEILTGKQVTVLYKGVNKHLSEVLHPVVDEENGKDKLSNFMDPSLQGDYPADLAIFVAKLVYSLLSKDPKGRPGMDEIVQCLSKILNASLNWESSNGIYGY